MGRHNRRGYVGQTNLSPTHKPTQGPPVASARSHAATTLDISAPAHAVSSKRQLRAKWRLDLPPVPTVTEPLRARHTEGESAEAALAANIEAVQHERKSFKDEPWYRSPIGRGSKSSVILAALKQQDTADCGFLPRARIIHTLQHPNFGLSEHQISTLLQQYDPCQESIHYKTFVKQVLHFANPESQYPSPENDIVFRHQRYLEKIRDHATNLIAQCPSPSPKPVRLVTNDTPSIILGNSPSPSPVHRHHRSLAPLETTASLPLHHSPPRTVVSDPLSFENDKLRKSQRAQAKAAVLLAHINRVDEYSRHQDLVSLQHDNLRIAAKALHLGDHLSRVFEQQEQHFHRMENQGKAMFGGKSPSRSVSKDSMFYVDPGLTSLKSFPAKS